MNGRKKQAKTFCFKKPPIYFLSKSAKPVSETPITPIKGISSYMVEIPTFKATPVSLGHISGRPGLPIVKLTLHRPVNTRRVNPDIQFRRAVLGVIVFLMILSSVLVGGVIWYSYKYTDKEIKRNFLKMFNITEMKDRNYA